MELSNSLDSDLTANFSLSQKSKAALLNASFWAKFLSIVGFVILALFVLILVYGLAAGSDILFPYLMLIGGGVGMVLFGILTLIMIALLFFPSFYLYRFATLTKQGIEDNSSDLLSTGLENLKSFLKFLGISTIVIIVLQIISAML